MGDFCVNDKIFQYLDELLIVSNDSHEALGIFTEICRLFDVNKLKINVEKLSFFQEKITFLCFEIYENGRLPSELKMTKITKLSRPKDIHEVKSVTASTTFYRSFIPDHAALIDPFLISSEDQNRNSFGMTSVKRVLNY